MQSTDAFRSSREKKIFSWYRIFVTYLTLPYGRVVHDYLS